MDIYSDAQVSKVTGDLSGFDLALDKPDGSQRKALLLCTKAVVVREYLFRHRRWR
jgi:hypothetical protein